MTGKFDRAMACAKEYEQIVAMGQIDQAGSIRRTIEDLVGYFEDGKLRLPDRVRIAMGLIEGGDC